MTDSNDAAVSIAQGRSNISTRRFFTSAAKAGLLNRRYTVLSLTPALRAALSTVEPQASAIIRA